MARNFVIQYIGREGSSAIISALSIHPGVNVPLFEELDEYDFLETHSQEDYPQALDEVFTTGAFSGEQKRRAYLHSHSADSEILTTGFKWRVNGHLPDVAKVLTKHNVMIFALLRRNFLNFVCSTYVHNYGNQLQSDVQIPLHPHFKKESGSADGSDAAQRVKLNDQSFPLDKKLFLMSARQIVNDRQRQTGLSRRLARAGLPISVMYYEDFDEDPERFITQTIAKIGLDIAADYTPFCGFDKVHKQPLSERISGLQKITSSWRYRRLGREYQAAIHAVEALSTP